MVRLEVPYHAEKHSIGKFQFLYGAIGSGPGASGVFTPASFNSYMVRLEVSVQAQSFLEP